MRTGRERLKETLWDFYIEADLPGVEPFSLLGEYADRIMEDINLGIIAPERPGV